MAQSCQGKKIVREAWERGEKPPKKKNVGGLKEIDDIPDIPVIDVSPITLGILLHDGTVSPLIKKNSPVPAQETKRYTNQHEGMEYIGIVIMQGDNPDGKVIREEHCTKIHEFELEGFAGHKKNQALVELVFEINEDCTL